MVVGYCVWVGGVDCVVWFLVGLFYLFWWFVCVGGVDYCGGGVYYLGWYLLDGLFVVVGWFMSYVVVVFFDGYGVLCYLLYVCECLGFFFVEFVVEWFGFLLWDYGVVDEFGWFGDGGVGYFEFLVDECVVD